jgi:hypothetical protein
VLFSESIEIFLPGGIAGIDILIWDVARLADNIQLRWVSHCS